MRIKRFEAPDSKTAFALVKKELGEDAVILANRTLDAGTANQRYEVVAAMDYDLESITVAPADSGSPLRGTGQPAIYGYDAFRRAKPDRPAADPPKQQQAADRSAISFEANDLRLRFAQLLRKNGVEPPARPQPSPSAPPPPPRTRMRPDPEEVSRWRNQLIDQLQVRPPAIGHAGGPVILVLTGPTGVGKTTTSAKIAAWYKLRENRKVALLSMDCYRIGATDQIRTYARIMKIPCEIVLHRNDLRKAVDRHRGCDLIIIDTAGKSPYDPAHIDELARWLAGIGGIEPQLVLSATTKKEDLKYIIDAYAPLGPTGLILTKLDETRAYATLCQQITAAAIPITYLATGQRVPEDFYIAAKPLLEKLFKQGWNAALGDEGAYAGNGL